MLFKKNKNMLPKLTQLGEDMLFEMQYPEKITTLIKIFPHSQQFRPSEVVYNI